MAPMASRDGLRWKIEELTARSVRSLTVLGSPLPRKSQIVFCKHNISKKKLLFIWLVFEKTKNNLAGTVMSTLAEMEVECDLAPIDEEVKCGHCNEKNG